MAKRAPQLPGDTSPISSEDGGHFGVGLVVGSLLGAAGMYLFGTDKGKETLQHLREELERLKDELNTDEAPSNKPLEIPRDIKDLPPVEKPEVLIADTADKEPAASATSAATPRPKTTTSNTAFPKFKRKS